MRIIPIIPFLIFLSCNGNNTVASKNWARSNELTHRSKRLLEKNVLDSAENLITEAIRLDPTNYEAYNNRAYLKSKLKRPPSEVIADLEKALSLKPDYDIAIFSFPNYYFSIKDYKKAIKYSNKALELTQTKLSNYRLGGKLLKKMSSTFTLSGVNRTNIFLSMTMLSLI
jgi:tetratricopeptide (TPR) repeat protein